MLNNEQVQAFEEYDSTLLEISGISEKQAFVTGFRFAAKILFEILYED